MADHEHLWKDGWCAGWVGACGIGWATWAGAEIERLRRATRTRPDYNLRCDECGASHFLDTSIPSETWNRIADGASVLCAMCIDDRLAAAGLTAIAEFYYVGTALTSKLYAAPPTPPAPDAVVAKLIAALEMIMRDPAWYQVGAVERKAVRDILAASRAPGGRA